MYVCRVDSGVIEGCERTEDELLAPAYLQRPLLHRDSFLSVSSPTE